jgi:hypothetical protein
MTSRVEPVTSESVAEPEIMIAPVDQCAGWPALGPGEPFDRVAWRVVLVRAGSCPPTTSTLPQTLSINLPLGPFRTLPFAWLLGDGYTWLSGDTAN